MFRRWLAGQYSRPSGRLGRLFFGRHLDRLGRGMNLAMLNRLGPKPGEVVLEVGFGGGDLLARLVAADVGQAIGVDISEAMVARAKRRFRREIAGGTVRIACGSASNLPVADQSVDRACSANVVYFWDDPSAVMAEFARVLRPGGRLVLCFQTAGQVRLWPGHVHGFRAIETEQARQWFVTAGFGSIEVSEAMDSALGDFLCLSGELVGARAGK